jgi:hypothetical protein
MISAYRGHVPNEAMHGEAEDLEGLGLPPPLVGDSYDRPSKTRSQEERSEDLSVAHIFFILVWLRLILNGKAQ